MQHPTPLSPQLAGGLVAAPVAAMRVVVPLSALAQEPTNLDIYGSDVEGGAATFVVTPARESVLMDTENRLGVVDLWQVPHHGGYGAIGPELAGVLQPTVTAVNNGPRKGGRP